jgi:integrase
MPTIDLTSAVVKELKCPEGVSETVFWARDLPGFGLRCRGSGERRWFVQYRNSDGITRKSTLGTPDAPKTPGPRDLKVLTLSAARAAAKGLLGGVTQGRDPAAEAGRVRSLITMGDLAAAYLERQREILRPHSLEAITRHLNGHYLPVKNLLDRKALALTARDVVGVLEAVARDSGGVTANRLRATLAAMWNWGLRTQRVTGVNPAAHTLKPAKEAPRARVLADPELTLIWQEAGGGSYGAIVRLLLLTGQRREEVAGMRWSEIKMQSDGTALWSLPGDRTKNGLPHDVPLVAAAVKLLPAKRDEGDEHVRDLVFGGGQGGTHKAWEKRKPLKSGKAVKHGEDNFGAWSRSKDRLDGRLARANGTKEQPAPIPAWVLHDLRRTFVTGMNNMGIEPHVIEAAVNHTSGAAKAGVAGVYNRSRYTPQVRAAMKVWADHVAGLVEQSEQAAAPAVAEAA